MRAADLWFLIINPVYEVNFTFGSDEQSQQPVCCWLVRCQAPGLWLAAPPLVTQRVHPYRYLCNPQICWSFAFLNGEQMDKHSYTDDRGRHARCQLLIRSSSGVQYLQTGELRNRTSDLLITGRFILLPVANECFSRFHFQYVSWQCLRSG